MMPQLADCKTAVVKGLGFGAGKGNKSLVAVARIEKREFITLFGSDADGNAEVVTNKEEVEELKAMIARNHGTTGGFQYKVAKHYTSNTSFTATQALVVQPRDVHQALKLRPSASLVKTHRKRRWEGIGQLANHTCCEQYVNAEIILMMYEEQVVDHQEVMSAVRAQKAIEKGSQILVHCDYDPEHGT